MGCRSGRLRKDPTRGRARRRPPRPRSETSLAVARYGPPAGRNPSPDIEAHRMNPTTSQVILQSSMRQSNLFLKPRQRAVMPRTIDEITARAEELAARFEDHEPAPEATRD